MTSPSKTKYFRATLHNGSEEMPVVSYNPSVHETLQKAKDLDKAVMIKNFRQQIDQFSDKTMLTLGNRSVVAYSDKDIIYMYSRGCGEDRFIYPTWFHLYDAY